MLLSRFPGRSATRLSLPSHFPHPAHPPRRVLVLAAALAAVTVLLQPAAGEQGRACHEEDVFDSGDFATAFIPSDCTELYLGDLLFGDSGATAVAEALKINTALTSLNLDYNNIGDKGAAAIAEALKGGTALTELMLENNKIGNGGAIALAEALTVNEVLRVLDLKMNNIEEIGVAAFAEAVKVNRVLVELLLEGSAEVSWDISGAIEEALFENDRPNRLAREAAEEAQRAAEKKAELAAQKKAKARKEALGTPTADAEPKKDNVGAAATNKAIASALQFGVAYVHADRGSVQANAARKEFEVLVAPLLLVPRRRLTKLLNEQAAGTLTDLFNANGHNGKGAAANDPQQMPIAEWGAALYIPVRAIAELENLGVYTVSDVGYLEQEDVETVAQKVAGASFLDAWWFERGVGYAVATILHPKTADDADARTHNGDL